MYSYTSVNCHRESEGDRKPTTAEMKCGQVQGSQEVEWPFDTYLEPHAVTMGQINLDPEPPNGRTQFLNSDSFCYTDFSVEVSKDPNVLTQDLGHERQGMLLNPGNGVAAGLAHCGYSYETCSSSVSGCYEQGNDLIRSYVPSFTRAYGHGYSQEMGGHEFTVPPLQPPPDHPPHPRVPPRLRHSADPSREPGCSTLKDDSHFLHSLSQNEDMAAGSTSDEFPRCYGDLSNVPQPPFIKIPASSSVSLMDISQSHLDDGLHHEVIRRRRRREQNRIAARKCREKKKENVDNMLKDYSETLKENERLRLETEKLQTLVASLQTIVKSHQTNCNFSSPLQTTSSSVDRATARYDGNV